MARPKIQFQLQQPSLRPVASPVDTFAQPNPVPPAEAVTNEWLLLAKGLSELSPGLSDFLKGIEEDTREKSAAEAQAAMESFDGDASIFATLPKSTGKEAEAWFKANKDAFGGSEFRYAARPDFQLAFQVAQGRWEVNQNKRFQLEDGTAVTYRDFLYSHADELSDPNSDARQQVEEWRKEFFEGLDPTKSIAYREGVISAAAPMESQFLNTVEARQVAAADALTRQASVDELMGKFDEHRRLNVSVSERPASDDETPAEAARREEANQRIREDNTARETALKEGIVNILEGPQFIGGISKNKVLFEALDTMARVTQADTEDELEAEEFLEWAKTLPGLGTAYWQGRFEEIQSNIEIRERQRGKDDGLSTLPEVRNQAQWRAYGLLKDSGATTLEEALGVLRQPENQAQFEEMLSSNKLSASELEALIGGSAESFISRREGTGYPTSKEGTELLAELNARIALEGANPEIMALLESPETQEALGGTEPKGAWAGLVASYQAKEEAGFRDRDFDERARVAFGQVVPQGERGQYSPGDQALIEELELDFLEELRARSTGVDDPDERRKIAKTLEREFKQRQDILDLKDRNYRVAPGLLYDKGLSSVRTIVDSEIDQLIPLTRDEINTADPSQSRRGIPIEGAAARQAEAQIEIKRAVQPYIRILSDHLDNLGVTDISRRNEFIQDALILGFNDSANSGLVIPKLRDVIERYGAGATTPPPAPPAIPGTPEPLESDAETDGQARATAVQVQKSEKIIGGFGPLDLVDAERLGATRLAGLEAQMDDWAAGTQYLWLSNERDGGLKKSATFREQFKNIHSHGTVRGLDPGAFHPTEHSLDRWYPSPNDMVLIYASNLMLDPDAKQPTDWYDNGDFMSDIGVDFNAYADNPEAVRMKYTAAKINKGLTVGELRLGRTREGIELNQFLPEDRSMWPLSVMLIGPQNPTEFSNYVREYREADDPSSTDLGFVMEYLGIMPNAPVSATDSTTHGEKYVSMLEQMMQARVESMAGQQYGLDRDYGDYPRLQMRNKGLYEAILYGGATPSKAVQNSKKVPFSDADERFFSPATRRVLKAERKFYADLERLNKQ
jgi:hypothetical protein